jgi:hypothetical protein
MPGAGSRQAGRQVGAHLHRVRGGVDGGQHLHAQAAAPIAAPRQPGSSITRQPPGARFAAGAAARRPSRAARRVVQRDQRRPGMAMSPSDTGTSETTPANGARTT